MWLPCPPQSGHSGHHARQRCHRHCKDRLREDIGLPAANVPTRGGPAAPRGHGWTHCPYHDSHQRVVHADW